MSDTRRVSGLVRGWFTDTSGGKPAVAPHSTYARGLYIDRGGPGDGKAGSKTGTRSIPTIVSVLWVEKIHETEIFRRRGNR